MKTSLIFLIFSAFVSAQGFAQSAVQKVCTSYSSDTCMSVKFMEEPNSVDEAKFQLKIWSPNNEVAQNVGLDLWMQMGNHGHGSAPVQLTSIADNNYHVENAWFVMKGEWQLRVSFEIAGQVYQLKLPVQIKE